MMALFIILPGLLCIAAVYHLEQRALARRWALTRARCAAYEADTARVRSAASRERLLREVRLAMCDRRARGNDDTTVSAREAVHARR